ncbi:MAG: NAD(P)/FAD-dependent oxidoreductase [Bacteroidales bacterium]|nr:NAD(P)/FAD-dependent oxidoreductase [Bacteroidales bacterium]
MKQIINIPPAATKRVVIVGGGFAGTELVKGLLKTSYQIVLFDKNNFYQFQPLLYQVAMSGLEPSAISFPLRRIFRHKKRFFFRMAEVTNINPKQNEVETNIGSLSYDYLVLSGGVTTNFFGNKELEKKAFTMKSVSDAIFIRNAILENYERALDYETDEERQPFLNLVIVGGGPAGVELAGSLAEMKKFILPKDYPELDFNKMKVYIFEAGPKILSNMRENSSTTALKYLKKLGIDVQTGIAVQDYDGENVKLSTGEILKSKMMIWTAGVTAKRTRGMDEKMFGPGGRILTDRINKVQGADNIFAIGDISLMQTEKFPKGHPQVAQVAMQQARHLAKNFSKIAKGKQPVPFKYIDKGMMATVGRNLAIADLPGVSFKGFFAWLLWSVVHLISIMGSKNKVFVFLDWATNYYVYDPSLRLLIKPKLRNGEA